MVDKNNPTCDDNSILSKHDNHMLWPLQQEKTKILKWQTF